MPIYSLAAPDGNTYDIEAAFGLNDQQVSSLLYSLKPEAATPFVKESGNFAQAKQGLEQLVSGAQTAGGVLFGDANEAARLSQLRQAEMQRKYEAPPSLERAGKVFDEKGLLAGLGQVATDLPEVISAQLPNLATSYAGARTGAFAGQKLGSPLGARGRLIGGIGGGLLGTFAPSYVQSLAGNVDAQAEEDISQKKPIDINVSKAALTAIPQAALDTASERILLGGKTFGKMIGVPEKLLFESGEKVAEKLAREGFAKTLLKGTAQGAAGESLTEVGQEALQRYQAGQSLTGPDAYKAYGEAAYQAALMGPLGAAGRFAEKSSAKAEVQQNERNQQDAKQADQQDAPAQTQDITTRYQEAEKRKAELKSQTRKVEEGSVTETADRLFNTELENQIAEMNPELERLAQEYNVFKRTATEASPETTLGTPSEITPVQTPEGPEFKLAANLTVGDSLDDPLGRFSKEELTSRSPNVAKYIDKQRNALGKPALSDYSIEDIRDAMPNQIPDSEKADLSSLVAAKSGHTGEVIYKPQDVINIAKQKNINTDTTGFKFFLQRATGENDLSAMSQPQLHSAFKSLSGLPKFEETQNLAEKSNATHFSPEQYKKSVDKIKSLLTQGIVPSSQAQIVAQKESGLKRDTDVQYLLQKAYRDGDLDLDSRGNFIAVKPSAKSEFAVEETFRAAEPTGFNVMRGDKVLFSTQNESEATEKAKRLNSSTETIVNQLNKSIEKEQKSLVAGQRALDKMESDGLFGTPKYDKASSDHSAAVDEVSKKIADLNTKKDYIQQDVIVQSSKKSANVKAFKSKEKGVSEQSFDTREEAQNYSLQNLGVARLNEISNDTKSPGLKKRIAAELERRKKPFLSEPKSEPKTEPKTEPTEKPEVTAQKEAISSNLIPMLRRFGLGDVALKIEAGMKEDGSYVASVIRIALDSNNPIRVLRHEVIHGLKDLGFFTPGQMKVLENKADSTWINKYLKERNINGEPLEAGQQSRYDAYDNLYNGDIEAIREEAIADAFADFDVNGAPKGLFSTILDKMRTFFESLGNALRGAGYETSDDVFGKIERGELKSDKQIKQGNTNGKYTLSAGKAPLRSSGRSSKRINDRSDEEKSFVGPATESAKNDSGNDTQADRGISEQPNVIGDQGKGFTAFFSNISLGFKGKPNAKPYEPTLNVNPIADFVVEYNGYRGNFDDHIASSIPAFREVQVIVGDAISKTYKNADMLDIGASEGALIKAITKISNGEVRTVALDPNFAMAKHFTDGKNIKGAVYDTSAFGTKMQEGQPAWTEEATFTDRDGQVSSNPFAGKKVRYFKPDRKFDVVHEAMVFQFISGDRLGQIERIKELMKPDGVLIIEEKFISGNQLSAKQFRENENKKNTYKEQYFTKAEIEAKAKAVGVAEKATLKKDQDDKEQQIVGMNNLMVSPGEIEFALSKNFNVVTQFWDSGNFKGYVASDSRTAVKSLIDNMLSTDSKFSNVNTPRTVKYSLATSDKGIVLGTLQADAVEFSGVHYGKVQTNELQGIKYGSGMRGAERRRLQNTDDQRIKKRVYFYISKPDNTMPVPEDGVGNYVYTQRLKNILGPGETMSRLYSKAREDSNAFESSIVDAGYDGYAAPSMGMMVILNHDVPVNYQSTRAEYDSKQKPSLRSVSEDIKNMPNGAAILAAINRTTHTRKDNSFIEGMTGALAPESFSRFRAQALDKYNRLNDYEKVIAKQMGGVARLADLNAHSAALQSDLSAGVTASALGVEDRIGGVPVFKNGFTTVSNEGGTIKGAVAIFAPLAKRGDPKIYQAYQFWAASKRGKRLLASGREELFTPQDFAYAKQLEQMYPEFVDVQKDWIKFNDGLVKYAVDTGVISAQNAAEFVKYSDYLPFYRQLDGESTIGPNIFQSMTGVKAPKKLTGSDAPLADFLETIVRNTQATIQAGMKNVAAQKAVQAGSMLGVVRKLNTVSSAPNVVTVLEKGKKVSYESADSLFIDAVTSLNLPEMPFLSIFSKPADLLRNLVTKDPGFIMANLMRDSISAYVTSGANITPLVSTVKEFGSTLLGTSPEYQKLLNAGVLGGYEFSRNIEASAKFFEKDLRKKSGTRTTGELAASPFTIFWDALEKGTNASDAATRIAIYKATLKETGNEAEAIHRSLEVMNFNRKGSSSVVRIAAAVIPFLNARIQGLDVFFRSGIRPFYDKDATAMEKQVQKLMLIRGSTVLALSTMYAAAMMGNSDYEDQEEETRDLNWIIPLGEGRSSLKIPIPFEVGTLFKVLPERIYRNFYGQDTDKNSIDATKRALTSTFGFTPIPQVALPFIEVATDYSMFTHRTVVPSSLKDIAPQYQVSAGTSKAAEEFGKLTGLSPIKVEHIYKGYTGTMGMYAVDLVDAAISSFYPESEKATKRFEQLPVIKRFVADPDSRGNVTAYYDLKNSVDQVVRTINLLEKQNSPDLPEYYLKNQNLYFAKDFVNDLAKQMKDLQDQASMIRSAPIPGDQKRDLLLQITKAQNMLLNDIKFVNKIIRP